MAENNNSTMPGYVPCVEAPVNDQSVDANVASSSSGGKSPNAGSSHIDPEFRRQQFGYTEHEVIILDEIPKVDDDDLKKHNEKPNDYVELSVVACLFNFIFGLVSLTLSFKSGEKWSNGNRKAAKRLGIGSMLMSVLAIISTAVIIFICIWFFVPRGDTMET